MSMQLSVPYASCAGLMESDQLRGGPLTLRSRLNTNFSSNYHFLPFPATFFETIITPFFCISLFLPVSCMYCIEKKKKIATHPGHFFWSPCPSNNKSIRSGLMVGRNVFNFVLANFLLSEWVSRT